MTMYKADGTRLSKTAGADLVTEVTETDPWVTVDEHLYEGFSHEHTNYPESGRRLKYRTGDQIRQSAYDANWPDATIATVTPSDGPAAGGTPIVIVGTNFTPGTTVTVGGNAATSIVVVNSTKITCTTAAHAAGAEDVVVTSDAGAVTKTDGFTFE